MKKIAKVLIGTSLLGISLAVHAATTLTVASFPDFDKAVTAAIPEWKKLYPDVDIKIVSEKIGEHHTTMKNALVSGNGLPDVMGIEFGFIGGFAELNGLEDLSRSPYNARFYQHNFVSFTFPQATSHTGELVAMPADIGPGTLFYRKDILDKAGVSESALTKSWESYIQAGKTIKAKTGILLLPHANEIMSIYIRSGLKDGDGLYFDKDKNVLVEGPRFVRAFELAKTVRDAGLDQKIPAWSPEWTEGFKQGSFASIMTGAWLGQHMSSWLAPDSKGLWRAADLPGGAFGSWGGSFYGIPKMSKHKSLAWKFIKFMTLRKRSQINSFVAVNAFPALLEAQSDPFFQQPIEYLGGQKARPLWRNAALHTQSIAVDKYDPIATTIVTDELAKVLDEGKSIKAALADAKNEIERRAKRDGKK
ncbi:MAG: extracellular solute-binding protein [Pseudomonadota bacterium]